MRRKGLTLTCVFTMCVTLIGACGPAETNTPTIPTNDPPGQDSPAIQTDGLAEADSVSTPPAVESDVEPTRQTDTPVTENDVDTESNNSPATLSSEDLLMPMLTIDGAQTFAGTTNVEIPEVYELVTIALAMANLEEFLPEEIPSDGFLIDKSTSYYQDVDAHFGGFRDHPLIEEIRTVYQPMIDELDVMGLLAYRSQALTYQFDAQDELVLGSDYRPFSEAQRETPALEAVTLPFNMDDPATLGLLSDFAQATSFRQFYADQQDEYTRLTQLSSDLCNFEAMRDWLIAEFPAAYGSHRFVLSPLVGGTHNVMPFGTVDEIFIQIVMYVSAFKGNSETAADVSVSDRAAHCRTWFTEIVHGYVNPATDLHFEEVEQALPDITGWNTDATNQTAYSTSLATFNEYMTWAVYSLYIIETFPAEAQEEAIQYQEEIMVDRRGFVQYREFNRELMRLYKERETEQTITDLYPAILDWVAAQGTSE